MPVVRFIIREGGLIGMLVRGIRVVAPIRRFVTAGGFLAAGRDGFLVAGRDGLLTAVGGGTRAASLR